MRGGTYSRRILNWCVSYTTKYVSIPATTFCHMEPSPAPHAFLLSHLSFPISRAGDAAANNSVPTGGRPTPAPLRPGHLFLHRIPAALTPSCALTTRSSAITSRSSFDLAIQCLTTRSSPLVYRKPEPSPSPHSLLDSPLPLPPCARAATPTLAAALRPPRSPHPPCPAGRLRLCLAG